MDMPAAQPPMPPARGAPPPMPPRAGPPPSDAGGPGAELKAKAMQIASTIPTATKPFPAAAVQSVVDAFNEAKTALIPHIAGDMPMPKPDAGEAYSMLPPEVYVPIALLIEEIETVAPEAEKYECDPSTLKDVAGLRTLAGKLLSLAKDKKVVAAVKAKIGEQGAPTKEAEPEPGAPGGGDVAARFTKA